MGYKLIACDLDETLLDDNHRIAKRIVMQLKKQEKNMGLNLFWRQEEVLNKYDMN